MQSTHRLGGYPRQAYLSVCVCGFRGPVCVISIPRRLIQAVVAPSRVVKVYVAPSEAAEGEDQQR